MLRGLHSGPMCAASLDQGEEPMGTRAIEAAKLALCLIACQVAGLFGSFFTIRSVETWYVTIEKPAFNPPNWVFAPVWTTLFLMMGVAAFLVWRKGLELRPVKVALGLFVAQLILNTLWSPAFFGLRSPLAGLVVIALLWPAVILTIRSFFPVSKVAALLLVPYMLWISFAAVLNTSILVLNS